LVKMIAKGLLWFYGRPEISGKENIPNSGRVILVANHRSLLDGFLLVAFWPKRISFLAAEYLFELPGVGCFLRVMGAIPIQKRSTAIGLEFATQVLQGGGTLSIFPEGRIIDGKGLGPFKKGWAYLALKTGTTVIPVVITGTDSVVPVKTIIPRFGKIHMKIAASWKIEEVRDPKEDAMEALNQRLASHMEQMLTEI